jgi:site-specific recombinase XerD
MQVILKPLYHRGQECIAIHFEKNGLIQSLIQKAAGARWSKSNGCWYVPCTGENYLRLKTTLENKAELDVAELKKFLLEKKKNDLLQFSSSPIKPVVKTEIKKDKVALSKSSGFVNYPHTLSRENRDALQQFNRHLVLKSYSKSTIRTYDNEFRQFLQTIKDKPAESFSVPRLKDYLQYCFNTLHLSEATLHSRINALKFYYEQVLAKEKFFWEIPRPKKPLQLPRFFNQDEIVAILKATSNLKHKVMLMLAYSGGLRVSEVVAIKTANIDSKRMCILIEKAKGKKDRMVTLSPVLLVMLREYWNTYKPLPKGYLFSGQNAGEPYSTRSLQLVLNAAKQKAGILKPGSVHALRHSFATHLLDKGTDVTMIMKLLGHNDIKTTLRYLHVTNRDMLQVVSPLDNLNLE